MAKPAPRRRGVPQDAATVPAAAALDARGLHAAAPGAERRDLGAPAGAHAQPAELNARQEPRSLKHSEAEPAGEPQQSKTKQQQKRSLLSTIGDAVAASLAPRQDNAGPAQVPARAAYAPGWCGLHVRQTLWNSCMFFNHKDCVRVNHTLTLFDGGQRELARADAMLTFDGVATFLLDSALPFPVNVTQLGVISGIDLTPGSPTIGNFWPVEMTYAGVASGNKTWRNDDVGHCKVGRWQNYLENRDFDCGFSCPPP